MVKKLRILFCGFHLSGAKVLDDLLSTPEEFIITGIWTIKDPVPPPINYVSISEKGRSIGSPMLMDNPRKILDIEKYLSNIDLIVSVNYRYIIPETIYKCAEYGAINIHGSYLPGYRGRTPNTWAIINGEEYSGVSVHIIDEKVDAGPILVQEKIQIEPTDTGYSLFLKQIEIYPKLVRNAIYRLLDAKYVPIIQDETVATEYPVRKPEDGQINWSWSSLKIYNWIRAQAYPYPGAFTFINGGKIIVNNALIAPEISMGKKGIPGEVVGVALSPEIYGIWVSTGDNAILLTFIETNIETKTADRISSYNLIKDKILQVGDVLGR